MKLFASPTSVRGRQSKRQANSNSTAENISNQNRDIKSVETEKILNSDEPKTQLSGEVKEPTSYQVLPAITHTFNVQAVSNDLVKYGGEASSDEKHYGSRAGRVAKNRALTMASSVQLGEELKQFQSEPQIWEPKHTRNKVGSQFRTSHKSKLEEMRNKPASQLWSISSMTKSQVEYNFGGYVSRQQNPKAVGASFFNSYQDESRNKGFGKSQTSQLIHQARLMKKAVKRRQREEASKRFKYSMDDTQSELGDVIGMLAGESSEPGTDKLLAKQQMIVRMMMPSNDTLGGQSSTRGALPSSQENDTIRLENRTKITEMSLGKSKAKLSPSYTSKELTISNSVNKITITPPLVPLKTPAPYKHLRAPALLFKQEIPQPNVMSNQDLGSIKLEQSVDFSSLPSLAAAQARQMSRKANNTNLQAGRDIAQKLAEQKQQPFNDAGIKGIFGDSLQKPAMQSGFSQKQALFKLKHGRNHPGQSFKGQKLASSDDLPFVAGDTYGTSQQMVRSPTHEMVFHMNQNQDGGNSVQRSLLDTTSLQGMPAIEQDIKKNHQESLITSSSGRFAINSNLGMTNKPPMYDGDLDGRGPPASSINVLSPNFTNLDYGMNAKNEVELVGTPDSDQHRDRIGSRASTNKTFEQNKNIAKLTNYSLKSMKPALINSKADYDIESAEVKHVKGGPGRNNHFIVSDQMLSSWKSLNKEATPFQKFQQSLKGQEVSTRDMPTGTYMMLNTPVFQQGRFESSQTGSGTAEELASQAQVSKTRQSGSSFKHYANTIKLAGYVAQQSNSGSKMGDSGSQWASKESAQLRQAVRSRESKQISNFQQQDLKNVKLNQGLQATKNPRRLSGDKMISQFEDSQMLSVIKINVGSTKEQHSVSNKASIAPTQMVIDEPKVSTLKKDYSSHKQSLVIPTDLLEEHHRVSSKLGTNSRTDNMNEDLKMIRDPSSSHNSARKSKPSQKTPKKYNKLSSSDHKLLVVATPQHMPQEMIATIVTNSVENTPLPDKDAVAAQSFSQVPATATRLQSGEVSVQDQQD